MKLAIVGGVAGGAPAATRARRLSEGSHIILSERSPGQRPILLDVRTPDQFSEGSIPGAANIPLDDLRDRLSEIPRDRGGIAYRRVGQRGQLATRILLQTGFRATSPGGGSETYRLHRPG